MFVCKKCLKKIQESGTEYIHEGYVVPTKNQVGVKCGVCGRMLRNEFAHMVKKRQEVRVLDLMTATDKEISEFLSQTLSDLEI